MKPFDPKTTLFLIDGSSFLYRAYYGTRPLHTPQGIPVQAVYSFCRMIKKLITLFNPDYIAVVWDSKGPTTRHQMYADYKATRQAPPSDLFEQKKYIVQFAQAVGLRQVQQDGIEADDIMYSIAQERAQEGENVVFITSDKDMGQALSHQIFMYDAFKDKLIDPAVFEEEKGFPVAKLPFYFALVGDLSDNIPGVKGIGKVSATELVKQFTSLEDLYAHLDTITSTRTRTALETHKKEAFLSLQLFLLQNHPTGLTKQDFMFTADNWHQAQPLFQELGFTSLLSESVTHKKKLIIKDSATVLMQYDFKTVTTPEDLEQLVIQLSHSTLFAMDTETTGTRVLIDQLLGISFCMQEGRAYYVPFGHNVIEEQLSREHVLTRLKPILENKLIKKCLHNAKFDELVLRNAGIQVAGCVDDTLIAASLLLPEWQRLGLKTLSQHFFNEEMLSFDDVVKAYKLADFSYVPLALATRYAAADSHQTFKLYKLFEQQLADHDHAKIKKLYQTLEIPLKDILVAMEERGIYLDDAVLKNLDVTVSAKLLGLQQAIADVVGVDYTAMNLNSPKQVQELLFHKLQLPPQKKSAKGLSYSTDQEVLTALAKLHPVPSLILQYRELAKLKSTYIDALPMYINPVTGNIHTTYSQTSVATGRLASFEPNLQNIPADPTSYGIEIRAAFKPQPGYLFVSADYSQIELRVLAELSGDSTLVNAFLQGHDIHAQTASSLFDVALADVTHEQRQVGKRINFSILYGLTPYGLAKDLDISFKVAKNYIEKYFAQYQGISAWMEKTVQQAKDQGYVETYWGRRRWVPAIHEKNKTLYEEARRVVINTPVQGTASEVMKLGMIKLAEALKHHAFDAHMVLQIHDELLLSVRHDQILPVQAVVQQALESVVTWRVPMKVSLRMGTTWKEVTK